MDEKRQGEIALLLLEELIMRGGLSGFPRLNDASCIEEITTLMGLPVEEVESLLRPMHEKLLNKIFPTQKRDYMLRRDSVAGTTAIIFWKCIFKEENISLEHALSVMTKRAGEIKISAMEAREFTNALFPDSKT